MPDNRARVKFITDLTFCFRADGTGRRRVTARAKTMQDYPALLRLQQVKCRTRRIDRIGEHEIAVLVEEVRRDRGPLPHR